MNTLIHENSGGFSPYATRASAPASHRAVLGSSPAADGTRYTRHSPHSFLLFHARAIASAIFVADAEVLRDGVEACSLCVPVPSVCLRDCVVCYCPICVLGSGCGLLCSEAVGPLLLVASLAVVPR